MQKNSFRRAVGRYFSYVAVSVTLIFCVGCYTPNLLDETSPTLPQLDIHSFGSNVEAVDLPVENEESMRGVFVNAGEGAPVVLHFLGGGDTLTAYKKVAGKMVWIGDAVLALLDLGFSSLILDYRGVGRSNGKQNSQQLPIDAHVAWEEAVLRAGGDGRRVVLRAISLGTLAAASLLEEGAKPGAIILIAPLRADTVTTNWIRVRRSSIAAFFGKIFLRKPLAVEMETAISQTHGLLTIIFGMRDELLPSSEQKLLRVAARKAGALIIDRDQSHLPLVRDAYHLLPEEYISYALLLRKMRKLEVPTIGPLH